MDAPSRISIRDISARAGVHHTTVSRALRNSPLISLELRESIRQLAQEMGFQPDPALGRLNAYRASTSNTKPALVTLGYVTAKPYADHHPKGLLRLGFIDRCKQLGYHTTQLDRAVLYQPDLLRRRYVALGLDGLFVIGETVTEDGEMLRGLRAVYYGIEPRHGVPMV